MRHKAPLSLMEQAVMLAVFAVAAVLCLQAFVRSAEISREISERDTALLYAQSAAETLKSCGGDMAHAQSSAAEVLGGRVEQGLWYILYDENWNVVSDWPEAAFVLSAQGVPTEMEGLWKAEVWVDTCGNGDKTLCSLPIAWQGVD